MALDCEGRACTPLRVQRHPQPLRVRTLWGYEDHPRPRRVSLIGHRGGLRVPRPQELSGWYRGHVLGRTRLSSGRRVLVGLAAMRTRATSEGILGGGWRLRYAVARPVVGCCPSFSLLTLLMSYASAQVWYRGEQPKPPPPNLPPNPPIDLTPEFNHYMEQMLSPPPPIISTGVLSPSPWKPHPPPPPPPVPPPVMLLGTSLDKPGEVPADCLSHVPPRD